MGIEWIVISLWQYGRVRPLYGVYHSATSVRYGTAPYRTVLSAVNIIFVNLKYGHFGFIFHLRSQIYGNDVPRIIEKRELWLVLSHKPLEMRYCHNVGYCM
jgi:hypothetical protein